MAEASPGAQTPLCCQFCEISHYVKWKCFDCRLLLCNECKAKLHSKVTFDKEHSIFDICNLSEEDIALTNGKDCCLRIPCINHPSMLSCLYCKDCEVLICSSCLLESHKSHELEELHKALERKKEIIKTVVENIDQVLLKGVQNAQEKHDEQWANVQRHQQNTSQEIVNKAQSFIQLIQKQSDRLLEEHRTFYMGVNRSFESRKKILDSQEQNFLDKRNEFETVLTSDNATEVLCLDVSELNLSEYKDDSIRQYQRSLYFTEAGDFNDVVPKILGGLVHFSCIQCYETDLLDINLITANSENVWIANRERKILRKMKMGQDSLEIETNIEDLEVSGLGLMPSQELVIKVSKSNKLRTISQNGRQKNFKDFSPMKPTSLHVTSTGNILVGLKESGPNFSLTDNSKRQVVVLAAALNHRQNKVFEFEKSTKNRLFTYVWAITSTGKSDICVIDRLSDEFNGRILSVKQDDGSLNWVFNRKPGNEPITGQFKPRSIVSTPNGKLILSERLSHSLYLIDSENGTLLTEIDASHFCVYLPQSLCLDPFGNLWIGCSTYRGGRRCAKVHLTNIAFLK